MVDLGPLSMLWLIQSTGSKLAPSFYLMFAAAISLLGLLAQRRTWPHGNRAVPFDTPIVVYKMLTALPTLHFMIQTIPFVNQRRR